MRWRVVVGFVCFLVFAAVVGAGAWGVDRYVIRPAAHNASGPIPDPAIKEVGGPSITFDTTTVPASTTTKPTVPSHTNPSLVAATAALAKAAPTLQRDVVPTGSTFAGATWDQYGHIDFWTYANGTWTTSASRLYPPDAGDGSGSYSSEAGVKVAGQELAGMSEPIFIVSGRFSYDQADNALAFAYGANGWGVLVPQGSGQLVSDGGSLTYQGPGLEWGERFVAGRFETLQRPSGWDAVFDSLFPVTEQWAWQGTALSLTSSNVVTAQIESPPPSSAASLPTGGSVPDGLYAGRLESISTMSSSTYPLLRLQIEPGTVTVCNGTEVCFQPTGGTVSIAVGATTDTDYAAAGTSSTWISGPAWGLDVPGGVCCSDGYRVVPTQLKTFGASSWYVPSQLGVESFLEGTQPIVELAYKGGQVTTIYEPTGSQVG